MSEAAIALFFEQLKKDKALLNEYNSAVAKAMRSVVWPAMVAVATKHGFEFTEKEFAGYLESKGDELSEHELEAITGAGPASTFSTLAASPWALAQVVASTIAIPEAISDSKDDRSEP